MKVISWKTTRDRKFAWKQFEVSLNGKIIETFSVPTYLNHVGGFAESVCETLLVEYLNETAFDRSVHLGKLEVAVGSSDDEIIQSYEAGSIQLKILGYAYNKVERIAPLDSKAKNVIAEFNIQEVKENEAA